MSYFQQDSFFRRNKVLDGNVRLFSATLMGWGAYALYPFTLYYPYLWIFIGILGYGAAHSTFYGIKRFVYDYVKRRSHQNILNPISSKAKADGPTYAERQAAGIYEGDSGALLGWDIEYERAVFMPRNQPFRLGVAGSGQGKTAGHVTTSVILSALKKGK